MSNRKVPLSDGEYYHIFNRGVDKRQIFMDTQDVSRFFLCMQIFNKIEPIGSLLEYGSDVRQNSDDKDILVSIVAYCLNPNHFHLILRQEVEGGISEYMKRLSGGYTWYFNNKHDRSGALFQGRFKSKHIDTDNYLKYVSAYVNLNDRVHQFGGSTAKLVRSSWAEYITEIPGICTKDIVLGQFNNLNQYKKFALKALLEMRKNKENIKAIEFGG